MVSKDKYDLFEYKEKPKETSTTKFIADPPAPPEPPKPDYSYLKGTTPTGTYRGGGGKIWGGEISSTVGKELRGGKDPMSRPITDEEGRYLFGESWGGTLEDYYASKKKN